MYYSVEQLRALERQHLAQGLPLMQRAGQAAADFIAQRFGSRAHLLVLAGPGNNGGDALVAARHLKERGYGISLLFRGEAEHLPADAAAAWHDWQTVGGQTVAAIPSGSITAVIDGGFGIGLCRPLDADWQALIAAINALKRPLLALDVPSGIAADTGARLGAALQARWTLSFIGSARGLATGAARDHVGELHCDTLGLDLSATPPSVACSEQQATDTVLAREHDSHKGRFGTVAVLGGMSGMVGAALLAGRAALHAGAGKVLLGLLDPQAPAVDPWQPELMLGPAEPQRLVGADVLVVGPGLGPSGAASLQWALGCDQPLVLDADALNLLAGAPELRRRLAQRRLPCILTPHPSEAARLLGVDTAAVQADRYRAARSLARDLAATVLLKGAGSIVDDGLHTAVNLSGSAALANAGQGDVLSGILGALLAQGLAPWQAANLGAWAHGAASDTLVASDGCLVTPASDVLLAVGRLLGTRRR